MRIHSAIQFAAEKHRDQKRKGSNIPYIVHPMEVMYILTENNCEKDVIIAGILHDVLEDTNTTKEEIKFNFGQRILDLVQSESEDKTKTWQERKQYTIDCLKTDSIETKLVCCADKLSNIRSMSSDLKIIGEKLWEKFNAPKEKIKWYYESLVEGLKELKDYKMYKELSMLVDEIF